MDLITLDVNPELDWHFIEFPEAAVSTDPDDPRVKTVEVDPHLRLIFRDGRLEGVYDPALPHPIEA